MCTLQSEQRSQTTEEHVMCLFNITIFVDECDNYIYILAGVPGVARVNKVTISQKTL